MDDATLDDEEVIGPGEPMPASSTQDLAYPDFYGVGGSDVFAKLDPWWDFVETVKATKPGQYLYERSRAELNGPRLHLRDRVTGKSRHYVMMGSNDYLGLSSHPRVVEAGIAALRRYGSGSTGTDLFSGSTALHEELEARLAAFKGCEAALLFPSGYAANVGTLTALLRSGDVVINDRYNHASIIDGCRLSGARLRAFHHADMTSLERALRRSAATTRGLLVVVDSVFSMDGDIAPLGDVSRLARAYGARLMIDEAHAVGVLGASGRGLEEHLGVSDHADVVVGTLSKAFGCLGGFVAGSARLVTYLRFYARSHVFSAALPPAVVASALAALEVMEDEPWRRERLWANVRYLVEGLRVRGVAVAEPQSAIVPVMIGDEGVLRDVSKTVAELGLFVNGVAYPAVPIRSARLRLSCMATHTRDDLDFAIEVLADVVGRYGLADGNATDGDASVSAPQEAMS